MMLTGIGTAVPVSPGVVQTSGAQGTSGASLLPSPAVPAGLDSMSEIYALLSKSRQLGLRQSTKDLRSTQAARKAERQRAMAALRRAHAAKRKGGWFKRLAKKALKVAKIAAVVASVAMAVGTAGAATPIAVLAIAGATMSATAYVQSETKFLQHLGVSDRWASRIELGLAVGGAVCSIGAGVGALATQSESGASAVAIVGRKVSAGAAAAGGLSTAGAGLATWKAAEEEARAENEQANVVAARGEEAAFDRMILQILGEIEAAQEDDERVLGHLRSAIEIRDQTLSLSSMKV